MLYRRYILINEVGLSYEDLSSINVKEATRLIRLHDERKKYEQKQREKKKQN